MIRRFALAQITMVAVGFAVIAAPSVQARELCAGSELPLSSPTGRNAPYVDLSFEGKTGPFLIDYGASVSSLEDGLWVIPGIDPRVSADVGGQQIRATGLSWPGVTATPVTLRLRDRNLYLPDLRQQHGVIGIDLTERQNVELHYEAADKRYVLASAPDAGCDTAQFKSKGFVKLGQAGHWTRAAAASDGVSNGPGTYFALADEKGGMTKTFWARIDTGYEDSLLTHSIDINKALLDALQASGAPLKEGPSIQVKGCDGLAHMRRTFVAPGRTLRVIGDGGEPAVQLTTFNLLLKDRAEGCGGMSTSSEPVGQMGASFLNAFGATIFLGPTKEVWIRPARR